MYSGSVVVETSLEKEERGITNRRTWELVSVDHTIKATTEDTSGPYDPFSWTLDLACKATLCNHVVTLMEPTLLTHIDWAKILDTPEKWLNFIQSVCNTNIELGEKYAPAAWAPGRDPGLAVQVPTETVRKILKTVIEAQFETGNARG
jgi:hypothetical protein